MSKSSKAVIWVLAGGALLAALGYLAAYMSAVYFLGSLEIRLFEAEASRYHQGQVISAPAASGLAAVRLTARPGRPSWVHFKSPIHYGPGRIRAVFRLLDAKRPGGPGATAEVTVAIHKGPGALAAKTFSWQQAMGPGGSRALFIDSHIRGRPARLGFRLTLTGSAQLTLDCLEIQRPAGKIAWLKQALPDPLVHEPWNFLDPRAPGPWGPYHLPSLYEHLAYQVLARRLAQGATGPRQRARRLYEFVHRRLIADDKLQPRFGWSPWARLLQGGELCDGQGAALGQLADALGMGSRVIYSSFAPKSQASHSMVELAFEGKWHLFDPFLGLLFRSKAEGDYLSFAEAVRAPQAIGAALARSPHRANRKLAQELAAFFANSPRVIEKRPTSRRTGYGALPAWLARFWAFRLQDHYLAALAGHSKDQAHFHLAAARNLHLFGRWEKAAGHYAQALKLSKRPEIRAATGYHWGWLERDQGRIKAACARWQKGLAANPQGRWARNIGPLMKRAGCK